MGGDQGVRAGLTVFSPASPLAVPVHSEMGRTPALGVATQRPRRVASRPAALLNGESLHAAQEMVGEGVSHYARGERAPLLPHRSASFRSGSPYTLLTSAASASSAS